MAKKTIMLVCAAGMSTSMLVKKMEDAAAKEGVDAKFSQRQQLMPTTN